MTGHGFLARCTCDWASKPHRELSAATEDANAHGAAMAQAYDARTHRIVVGSVPMVTPTVHLNGTSRADLLYQATGAAGAVQRAQRALAEAWPHGRDYYPQGPEALGAAEAQFKAWNGQLAEVYEGLMRLAERIAEAGR
jgi:hypothetical protein